MKTRLWLNVILVVVIVILVALVYFKPGMKKPAPTPAPLTTLNAANIASIKIARSQGDTVELARQQNVWQMIAPVKIRADQYLVKTLLDEIHAQVKNHFPVKPADLAQYGLNPPHIRLWLNGTEFDFGDTEPLNNYRYVKTGDTINLVNGLLYFRLDHSPLWWASKRLLPQGAHIVGLQLPNATLTLKGDKWQLAPANPAISADTIQALIANWQNAQAISTDKIGTGQSQGEVAIELAGDKKPLRFAILKDPDFLVLARPDLGLQYELDSGERAELFELKPATPARSAAKSATLTTSKKPAPYKDSAHARTAGSGNHPPRH